jgi:hypothetical protein
MVLQRMMEFPAMEGNPLEDTAKLRIPKKRQ